MIIFNKQDIERIQKRLWREDLIKGLKIILVSFILSATFIGFIILISVASFELGRYSCELNEVIK